MEKEQKKEIERFLKNINCLNELSPWLDSNFSVFDVLNISTNEIRHSNVLAWLFDTKGTHGLEDEFFSRIIRKIYDRSNNKYDMIDLGLLDLSSFKVYREKYHIDILLLSSEEKYVIAIENKVKSQENGKDGKQTIEYRKKIEEVYPDYKKVFVYLTVSGDSPSDKLEWSTLTYRDIYDVLDELIKKEDIKNIVKVFLNSYLLLLRRNIVEDRQLKEVCQKIYDKYKNALDLIYNNVEMNGERASVVNGMKRALQDYHDKGLISYEKDTTRFVTKRMNDILKPLKDAKGSWNTECVYYYWLEYYNNHMYNHLELGGNNSTDEHKVIFKKLITITKNKNCEMNFTYKRIYGKKREVYQEGNLEEEGYKTAQELIEDLLDEENKIFKVLSELS